MKNQTVIQKWLAVSLLKNAFGSSSDTTLKNLRDTLLAQLSFSEFPFDPLSKTLNIEPKFSSAELDNIFGVQYKTKYSYLILSLLYPDRDWKDNVYHEDHIFPKTEFSTAKLKARGYNQQKVAEFQQYFNEVLNLQLLTHSENLEKNSKDFASWITTRDANFKSRHSIPDLNAYSFDNFLVFIQERKKLLNDKLKAITIS